MIIRDAFAPGCPAGREWLLNAGWQGILWCPPKSWCAVRTPTDALAWAHCVRLYPPLLYHCARQIGLQDSDADDLVQEVFALLLRKLPEFTCDRQKNFRAWLRTVTRNKWRELRRRRHAGTALAGAPLPDVAAPDDAEVFWEKEYRQHLICQAIQLMQAEFRPTPWKACWETVVKGRPAAEVAAELGLSHGAGRSSPHRGRRAREGQVARLRTGAARGRECPP